MNQIQAIYEQSEYANEPHLTIHVDGKPLDKILHELYPEKNIIGLVPTLLDWLQDSKERKLVWERIRSKQKQVVPILMCPDDVDLWCIVINVEVEKTQQTVRWLRIGIDDGDGENMPESIGTSVEWLSKVEPMEFDKIKYNTFVSKFQTEIEKDEIGKLLDFWISRIHDNELIPQSVKAYHFNIVASNADYKVSITGANNYNIENDQWIYQRVFIPKEEYISLGKHSKMWNPQEIQSIVKNGIEQFIERRISPVTFAHTAAYITVGFDHHNLEKVTQRIFES
ncbi:hypothetical protein [uncultured Kordia sp.]|uniref:hypothetical protein n=1 Tax=uncultured Kordia sp. TaxID=507699 RepID=UPI00262C4D4D|nr:hypothetical protein [uncultured Kordia sp.]